MIEVLISSEMSVLSRATRRNILEDGIFPFHYSVILFIDSLTEGIYGVLFMNNFMFLSSVYTS
jgi:hypothetical protein